MTMKAQHIKYPSQGLENKKVSSVGHETKCQIGYGIVFIRQINSLVKFYINKRL